VVDEVINKVWVVFLLVSAALQILLLVEHAVNALGLEPLLALEPVYLGYLLDVL